MSAAHAGAAPVPAAAWRLAVLSDIHGNLPALQAVLAELQAEAVAQVVNLGDIVSGPLWPAETLDLLMPLGWPTLAGNHERQLLTLPLHTLGPSDAYARAALSADHLAWLAALPASRWLADDVWCCHGSPGSDLHYLMETVTPDLGQHGSTGVRAASADELAQRLARWADTHGAGPQPPRLLLCGHSHVPRAMQCGTTLVVNPGSVGLPAYDDVHPHPHDVQTGSPHARWALVTGTSAGWQVQLRSTPYDHEAAARQAGSQGRGDWADALRTGFVGRREADVRPRDEAGMGPAWRPNH